MYTFIGLTHSSNGIREMFSFARIDICIPLFMYTFIGLTHSSE